MKSIISTVDVIPGNTRIVGIAVMAIVAGLQLLDIEVASEELMSVVQSIGLVVAIWGAVLAKIRK